MSIRDMREWFFHKKVESLFTVKLDPKLQGWLSALQETVFLSAHALPIGVPLTLEIAALPQFDWRAEAARRLLERYPQHGANMKKVFERGVAIFGEAGKRTELLAQRFQGRTMFDPTILEDEYRKTCSLAEFIGHNYAPLCAVKSCSGTASVMAFSALLLFLRGWDMNSAISDFANIASVCGRANPALGNIMGLNPFHDYEAWRILKLMQDLNITVPEDVDIRKERKTIEVELRKQFNAPSMPP